MSVLECEIRSLFRPISIQEADGVSVAVGYKIDELPGITRVGLCVRQQNKKCQHIYTDREAALMMSEGICRVLRLVEV